MHIGYGIALEGDNKLIGWCVSIDWMSNNYNFINLYIIKEKSKWYDKKYVSNLL